MSPEQRRRSADPADEAGRMSLGEHLEELRGRVARSLVALVLACVVCIWPAKYLLELLARPVVLVLRRHGQPDSFLATSPVENLVVYIKVVLICGVIIAAPYIIYQLWSFVAVGLYRREKEWVRRLVPLSVGLFLAGVVFMYLFVLLVSLNFLVGFSAWLPLPDPQPTALEKLLMRTPTAHATSQSAGPGPAVPLVEEDPADPPAGTVWINLLDRKLKVQGTDGQTFSTQLLRDDQRALVTTHFKIGDYLSFLLVMMLAFGTAFQTPLVVVFLARTGIVPAPALRKYRKVVVLAIVVTAGILAPPDLMSHLLLSGPMILLFELGLLFAGKRGRTRRAAADESEASGTASGA